MRKLYKEHRKQRSYLQTIAEKMEGNFKKSQIGTHLRKLGLKKRVSTRQIGADAWGRWSGERRKRGASADQQRLVYDGNREVAGCWIECVNLSIEWEWK